jgi:predicted thioesterase
MLQPGDTGEASFITTDHDMAKSLAVSLDHDFPEVFATSRMIALMELAGARLMKPILETSQLSVGVGVCIKHLAATPNHTQVSAVARSLGWKESCTSSKWRHLIPQVKSVRANTREQSLIANDC